MIGLLLLWTRGIVRRRPGFTLGAMLGLGLTVSLLAALGIFIASSAATMTSRAVADLPIDWQVLLNSGSLEQAVREEIKAITRPAALKTVAYADVPGLSAATGDTVQTTGAGKVVGLSPGYTTAFAAEINSLLGKTNGVLVAQQTAANLHVTSGDTVVIQRAGGLSPVEVRVDGIVSLPDADAFFQTVGLPANAAPQAPPANVLLLPADLWHRCFDEQAALRPDSARVQLHVRLFRGVLPSDPTAAYERAQRFANALEARVAGSAVVGNNLAVRLGHVRQDALYARVLFLFLGLPGVILSGWLAIAVAASGDQRRRREQALLRTRGASVAVVLRLAALEAALVGCGSVAFGLALTWLATRLLLRPGPLPPGLTLWWVAGACLCGVALAAAAILYPAWKSSRHSTVAEARSTAGRPRPALWQWLWLDGALLALGAVELWRAAGAGYQIVLAPEGVASVSVHYEAFLGPVCLWLGGVLFASRCVEAWLRRWRNTTAGVLRPLAGKLAGIVAAALSRHRRLLARGAMMVALAVSFAVSTAIFNTTYQAQSWVDAELTNGADVAISGLTAALPAAPLLDELRRLPGVAAAQPMQHRFAYVGHDLQDLYGIDPATLGEATHLANAYFAGGNARATLAALARQPDGVLVSEETVKDFQLQPGDELNLRLQRADDHQYHAVRFHFVGVTREFPTAPKDSFLVANASYVAQQTGDPSPGTILIRAAAGTDPADLAPRVRRLLGGAAAAGGAKVSDLGTAHRLIGSNLTAVDLRGLTRVELLFAVLLVASASGLILALGLSERRRNFAILAALGATRAQLGAFLWSEALVVLIGGGALGAALGCGVALALVKVLNGVFDPPPEALAIPWRYLALLALAAMAAVAAAVSAARRSSHQRQLIEELRGF